MQCAVFGDQQSLQDAAEISMALISIPFGAVMVDEIGRRTRKRNLIFRNELAQTDFISVFHLSSAQLRHNDYNVLHPALR